MTSDQYIRCGFHGPEVWDTITCGSLDKPHISRPKDFSVDATSDDATMSTVNDETTSKGDDGSWVQ